MAVVIHLMGLHIHAGSEYSSGELVIISGNAEWGRDLWKLAINTERPWRMSGVTEAEAHRPAPMVEITGALLNVEIVVFKSGGCGACKESNIKEKEWRAVSSKCTLQYRILTGSLPVLMVLPS
ncbi:hypothetical protein BKA82DRAFT_4011389 [Pisolithus tinctorius]|nr:hypothetical protein BKA82DRAFT_4011389 [Pisolithus tinctorius]